MMIMSVEINTSWAYLTFAATSILALFITFDKEAALLYILLFGHYPVTKQFIEKIRNTTVRKPQLNRLSGTILYIWYYF